MINQKLFEETRDILKDIEIDFGGGCSVEKAFVMAWLIKNFNKKVTLDIGVYRGRSFFPQALAHKNYTNGIVYAVDPWDNELVKEEDNVELRDVINEFVKVTNFQEIFESVKKKRITLSLKRNCKIIRKTSEKAFADFVAQDVTFDLIHVDGNHDYVRVMQDLELYMPLLNEGGFMVLDNISWDSVRAAYELLDSKIVMIYEKIDKLNDFAVFWNNSDKKESNELIDILKDVDDEFEDVILLEKKMKSEVLIIEKENEIQQIKNELDVLKNSLIQKNQELLFIESSKFWKLRNWYLKLKFLLFSPYKFFNKYFILFSFNFFQEERQLVIIDDYFPNPASAFRIAEYNYYLEKFPDLEIYNKKLIGNDAGTFIASHEVYSKIYHKYASRIKEFKFGTRIKAKLFYTVFLNNIYHYLPIIERFKINFVFTLYPGGGFWINHDEEIDKRLLSVFKSPFFKKVIVTQKITYNYLVDNNFCLPEQIEFIFGVVLDSKYYKKSYIEKKYYKKDKNTFDICFVAYKYMEKGIDKGYDTFIEVAKKLVKTSDDVRFHVAGGFDEADIDVSSIRDRITFYGSKQTSFFPDFYSNMDMIISPTVPFKLFPGNFDGFPTGSCSEAGFAGVAVLCSDELNLNVEFKDKQDIRIIPIDTEKIVSIVCEYINDPDCLYELSRKCRESFLRVYDINGQMKKRMQVLNEYL